MPSDSFSHHATAMASPEQVWARLQLPDTWEGIAGVDRITDSTVDGGGALRGFSFVSNVAGREYLGTATSAGREEGRVLAWDIENSEITGRITVRLSPIDDGTSVTVSLDVRSAGMLSSMFFPVVSRTIGSGLPESVNGFVAQFDN